MLWARCQSRFELHSKTLLGCSGFKIGILWRGIIEYLSPIKTLYPLFWQQSIVLLYYADNGKNMLEKCCIMAAILKRLAISFGNCDIMYLMEKFTWVPNIISIVFLEPSYEFLWLNHIQAVGL